MKSHRAKSNTSCSTATTIKKKKKKKEQHLQNAENIENPGEQANICHKTLSASQILDLNALQEKKATIFAIELLDHQPIQLQLESWDQLQYEPQKYW